MPRKTAGICAGAIYAAGERGPAELCLISVIVPVFKVERYLRRCLDSILAQSFTRFECVLVDDGSPDNCPAICDEYAAKDARFRVIHKQRNEGLPAARKSGLDSARAELVFHVDSDDWLESEALLLLYKKQKETGVDIVIGGHKVISKTGAENKYFFQAAGNAVVYFLLCKYKFLWGKLYRKTLFNGYIVPETNVLEDAIVNTQLFSLLQTDKIQILKETIYNYDVTTNGIISQLGKTFNYHHYADYPMIQSCLWIENYLLRSGKYGAEEKSAFACFMLDCGIIPYIRYNKNGISKNEIKYLYAAYYKSCGHLYLLPVKHRLIVLLSNRSIVIGKIYIILLNVLSKIRRILSRRM